jgi:acylphosphatase
MDKRLEARVTGLVQGVSFRYYTQRQALSLGVKGWVRNEPNGDVRLVAEGTEQALQELLEFLKVGPPYAQVKNVQFEWLHAQGEFERFRITG